MNVLDIKNDIREALSFESTPHLWDLSSLSNVTFNKAKRIPLPYFEDVKVNHLTYDDLNDEQQVFFHFIVIILFSSLCNSRLLYISTPLTLENLSYFLMYDCGVTSLKLALIREEGNSTPILLLVVFILLNFISSFLLVSFKTFKYSLFLPFLCFGTHLWIKIGIGGKRLGGTWSPGPCPSGSNFNWHGNMEGP